jgi:hypothetical protein
MFPFLPLFSFPIQLYSILCLSELFLPVPSPPNITIITETSLSLTTLTPTSVLPTLNQLLYFQQVCALSLFLISHASKQHSHKNFSHLVRKISDTFYRIDQFWIISDEWIKIQSLSKCHCLLNIYTRCSDRVLCEYVEPAGCAVCAVNLQRFRSWDPGFGRR